MGSSPSPTSNILQKYSNTRDTQWWNYVVCNFIFMFLMSLPHLRCAFSLPDDPGAPMLKYSTPSPILKDYIVFQLGITKWMIF